MQVRVVCVDWYFKLQTNEGYKIIGRSDNDEEIYDIIAEVSFQTSVHPQSTNLFWRFFVYAGTRVKTVSANSCFSSSVKLYPCDSIMKLALFLYCFSHDRKVSWNRSTDLSNCGNLMRALHPHYCFLSVWDRKLYHYSKLEFKEWGLTLRLKIARN